MKKKNPFSKLFSSVKQAFESTETADGLKFTLQKDGTYAVGGFESVSLPDLIIPRTYQGLPVTRIEAEAFKECAGIMSISLPDTIVSIGEKALFYLRNLESITVSPENPIYHSSGNCLVETAAKTLVLGSSTSEIPSDGSVTAIDTEAFCGLSDLTSVTVPEGITHIGDGAFSDCTNLVSVSLPTTLESLGEEVFSHCESLVTLTIASGNATYHSAGNCIIETETKTLVAGTNTSEIPDDGSVTAIGYSAFSGRIGLRGIAIPESVTSIEEWAFADCTSLTEITVPASVTSMERYAFYECTALRSVTLEAEIETIGDLTFSGCRSLSTVSLPETLTSIESQAFSECAALVSITLPASVYSVAFGIFSDCTALCEVSYAGTREEWSRIECDTSWKDGAPFTTVRCTDGEVTV